MAKHQLRQTHGPTPFLNAARLMNHAFIGIYGTGPFTVVYCDPNDPAQSIWTRITLGECIGHGPQMTRVRTYCAPLNNRSAMCLCLISSRRVRSANQASIAKVQSSGECATADQRPNALHRRPNIRAIIERSLVSAQSLQRQFSSACPQVRLCVFTEYAVNMRCSTNDDQSSVRSVSSA